MMRYVPTMEYVRTRTRRPAGLAVLDASVHRPLDPARVWPQAAGRWITMHPGQEVRSC